MDEKNSKQQDTAGQGSGENSTGNTPPDQGGTRTEEQKNTQALKDAAAEYGEKLKELENREMKLLLREKLHDRDMPKELADIISCTDEKDIDKKLDILQRCGVGSKREEGAGFVQVGATRQNHDAPVEDPYRKVMGLK